MKGLFIILVLYTSSCATLMHFPSNEIFSKPKQFKQEVYFNSKDGTRLHGWWFKAKLAKGTIIQFHGNAQNISAHYQSLIWLVGEGYNLFSWDYRGYGKSAGDINFEGIHEDGIAALKTANRLDRTRNIIVYGQSMGGAIAMNSVLDYKGRVSLFVADSTFLSYSRVFSQTLAKTWISWPFSFIPLLTVSDKEAPENRVEKLNTPILIIHDRNDPVVNYSNSLEIYEKVSSEQKNMFTLNRGGHTMVFEDSVYRNKFIKLLGEIK